MATSGLVLVKNKGELSENDCCVKLYAYHDGYDSSAIDVLARLPFQIFQASKALAGKRKFAYVGENRNGHHFYSIHADFPPSSREDFDDFWDSNGANYPCYSDAIRFANHVVWAAFDHWNVIRGREDMSYPKDKPLCFVTCDDEAGEYEIFARNADATLFALANELVATLNEPLPDAAKVTVTAKRGGLLIRVPSAAIMKELTWESVKPTARGKKNQPRPRGL